MRESTARQLIQIVNDCSDQLLAAIPRMTNDSSEESLGLYRLHIAAILGLAVNSLVAPIWMEHPQLEEGSTPAGGTRDLHTFRMSPAAVSTAAAALAHVERKLREAQQVIDAGAEGEERTRYRAAVAQVMNRLT